VLNLGGGSQQSFFLRISKKTSFDNLLLLERLPVNIRETRLVRG
jgi:hypothetical protein